MTPEPPPTEIETLTVDQLCEEIANQFATEATDLALVRVMLAELNSRLEPVNV